MRAYDFSQVQGQAKAVNLLTRALESGRLAHAYLFTGPDGVGKTLMARSVAAALLCTGSAARPCGRCPGCLKFASGNHPDFLVIRPDGTGIRIDQIRELKKTLSFPPYETGLRVVILEEAQAMRREAGNSLLKVLEEPPPDNLLILVASDAEPILPTILSRCQVIPFHSLPIPVAAEIIARQDTELDRDTALALAELTGGCPGRAGRLEAGGALALHRELVALLVAPPEDEARRVETALAMAVRLAGLKEELVALLDLLRIFFRDALVALLGDVTAHGMSNQSSFQSQRCKRSQGDGRGAGSALATEIDRARERWNSDQLSDKIRAVDFAQKALARNCNRGLVCEVLLFDLL